MKTQKLAELSMLTAFAIIIFVLELQIPNLSPVPGVKLGLANIITVYAVYTHKGREVFLIVLVRVLLGAILSGQMTALLYSLSGSMLCLIAMLPMRRIIPESHIWMASVLGAVLHNAGQIAAAILETQTTGLIAYQPVLLVSGCIAGAFTGLCAQFVVNGAWRK